MTINTWIRGLATEASIAASVPWVRAVSRFRESDRPISRSVRPGLVYPAAPSPAARREPVAPPVLLVHGLGGTTSDWIAVARELRATGLNVAAISYRSFGTSLEQLAEELADAVMSLQSETGADKVHLVGHSLGGVVIAQALADGLLTGRVDCVVTLASPFGGSPWASLLPVGAVVRALRQGSPQLGRLARAHAPGDIRWLAITAGVDMIVPRGRSHPAHREVETVEVHGAGHMGLLQNPQAIRQVVRAICAGSVRQQAVA